MISTIVLLRRNRLVRLPACAIAVAALAALSSACKEQCPPGTVAEKGLCHRLEDAGVDSGAATAGTGGGSGTGTGTRRQGVSASGTGGAAKPQMPAIDPTVAWMCMKNTAGECTSCKQDNDCPKHVCEQGFCMDCRDDSQCGVDNSCISNRCVPERKPSSIWSTSGGGQTSGPGFKLQISAGTPAPAATASATGFKLSVAPGAGNF